jgi:hypothetical protein
MQNEWPKKALHRTTIPLDSIGSRLALCWETTGWARKQVGYDRSIDLCLSHSLLANVIHNHENRHLSVAGSSWRRGSCPGTDERLRV